MIIGIDLGTSNSAVACWQNGQSTLIPNDLGELLTPSAVSLDSDGAVLVGRAARDRLVSHPARTATSFKRYMGTERRLRLGTRDFAPEELSALVLASLKRDAEACFGEPVTEAVITVPAYFNDRQRKATRRAGHLAGLKVERLLNEPTAAALAYGMHRLGSDTRFLIFDLGGGTFDVSVLEIFEGVMEVRATSGDNRLGGDDFTEAIVDLMFREYSARWKVADKRSDEHLHQRVWESCDRARRALSQSPEAKIEVQQNGEMYSRSLTGEEFERLVDPLMVRLKDPVLRALRDGSVRADAIDEIVLAGGATRMPVVRQAVTRMFGRFPASSVNPDEVVALGAAVQAGLKMRHEDLRELVLTDVCPYTLGVETSETLADGRLRAGLFSPIIERNTIIPASRSSTFHPIRDGQTSVVLPIYQGESRYVADNVRLGEIEIPLPGGKAHETSVECRFTYDINGLLEVDLKVPRTGETRQLVITGDDSMDPDSLARRRAALAALKVLPRDQAENVAGLERARRCYEQMLGERRESVARILAAFEDVLDRQDPREVAAALAQLHEALDAIEGERYL